MPKSSKKQAPAASPLSNIAAGLTQISYRSGLPAQDSIVHVVSMATPAPAGAAKYRIIKTDEVDAYERGATPLGTLAITAAAPTGDAFKGKERKAAKLSIGRKPIETFADLQDLIGSLPPDEEMIHRVPPIGTSISSRRVAEEQRNVRVRGFLYAQSREMDNDFHLIFGRAPNDAPELYMTLELSGLPASSTKAFQKLKAARDAYKAFFGNQAPGLTYDFPDPPIPVEIEGSLFFDMTHSTGPRPGPKSLKSRMPTIWEIHPISKIVFEP